MADEKTFEQSLQRGLGGPILEIQRSDSKAKYRDVVLRCCLRDITHDWQVEGTKGYYLYSAICALDAKDEFEPFIVNKFLGNCKNSFFYQLLKILCCYANDGSNLSTNALIKKYDYYRAKKTLSNDEYQQWEEIATNLFYLEGFAAFKHYIAELDKRKTDGGNFDWFLIKANDNFGKKRIQTFFEKNYTESDYIKILADKTNAERLALDEKIKQHRANPDTLEKATLEDLVRAIKKASTDEYPRRNFFKIKRAFLKSATNADVSPLLEYAQSDDVLLAETAIECLAEFKDKRIHVFAVNLLNQKGLKSSALRLLVKNYKATDDKLIWKLIKKSSIPHGVQIDFRDIYLKNKSKESFPALFHVYQKGECAFCRYYIVKAMENCGVLSDKFVEECLCDSYDDTRKLAERIIKKRNKTE